MVNFKNYKEASGEEAIELAKICERVGRETGVEIVSVVSITDLEKARQSVGSQIWVQHVDGIEFGSFTGWILPERVKEFGASGTLLNHSEHKLINDELRRSAVRCKELGLKTCICADSAEEAARVAEFEPDYVAYEPPELIGNRDKSVSSEHPDVIEKVVKAVKVPVLIGAGVHSGEDVRVGLKLGAKGILVASDVVLSQAPESELRELANAFGKDSL